MPPRFLHKTAAGRSSLVLSSLVQELVFFDYDIMITVEDRESGAGFAHSYLAKLLPPLCGPSGHSRYGQGGVVLAAPATLRASCPTNVHML